MSYLKLTPSKDALSNRSKPNLVFVSPTLSTDFRLPYYNVQLFNISKGLRKYFNIAIITKEHKLSIKTESKPLYGPSLYFTKSVGIQPFSQLFYALGEYIVGLNKLLDWLKPKAIVTPEDFSLTTLRTVKYCRKNKLPSIVYHGPYFYAGFPLGISHFLYSKTIGKYVYKNADLFIAKTQKAASFLTRIGCNPQKITVIPPSIDMNLFRFVKDDEFMPNLRDKRVLLFVGHLSAEKNPLSLLFAFSKLRKMHDDIALLIITQGGKMRPKVDEFIKLANLQKDVHIIRDVPNVQMPSVYSNVYATVSPSTKEIFGMNILESLACETPLVATPTGGAIELIKHETNGLMTRDFSPKTLLNCLERILDDAELYLRLKRNSRRSVENNFDIETISEKWFKIIRNLT
jgi:glycosyltransferase involved in cell wall biosynthesis